MTTPSYLCPADVLTRRRPTFAEAKRVARILASVYAIDAPAAAPPSAAAAPAAAADAGGAAGAAAQQDQQEAEAVQQEEVVPPPRLHRAAMAGDADKVNFAPYAGSGSRCSSLLHAVSEEFLRKRGIATTDSYMVQIVNPLLFNARAIQHRPQHIAMHHNINAVLHLWRPSEQLLQSFSMALLSLA